MLNLSIIIVNWNAKKFLVKYLRSLTSEIADLNAEIIVVDNASTDGSQDTIQKDFHHVKLIKNDTNVGFAKANNIGIEHSIGKYVCLVNPDVVILDGCIEKMCAYMNENPSVGILGPKILNSDLTLQKSCRKHPTLLNTFCRALALDRVFPFFTFYPHDRIRRVEVLSGCFLMVRREAVKEVGLLDEGFFMYAEDKDWCRRFCEAHWEVVYFPDAEVIHYGGASSSNQPVKFFIEMHRANLKYWNKYYSRTTVLVYLLIILLHQLIRVLKDVIIYTLNPSRRKTSLFKIKRSVACIRWLFNMQVRLD